MAQRIYFRGTKADIRRIVDRLRLILVGQAADPLRIAQGVFLAIGFSALRDVQQDFIRKARGGVGEDGATWPKLSAKYLAYGRRFGPGEQTNLKKAHGLGRGHRFAPGNNKGLLTAAQLARWKQIFAQQVARFALSMSIGEAEARAAVIAWSTLKKEGAKTKLEVFGNRSVEILRDSGVLLNSLSPGRLSTTGPGAAYTLPSGQGGDQQICEALANGVIVGTNVPYAAVHNYGCKKLGIPKRQFLPDDPPEIWWQRWLDTALKALTSGARLAFTGKGLA